MKHLPRTAGRRTALALVALVLLRTGTIVDPEAELRGRARSRAGGPLAGATVYALELPDPVLEQLSRRAWQTAELRAAKADARGAFKIRVPEGRMYRVWAVDPGSGEATTIRHDSRTSSLVSLRALKAASIAIELPGADPLAFALFGFDNETRREFLMHKGRLDAKSGPLACLAPGRYRLRVRTADGRAAESSFLLGPGQSRVWKPELALPARVRLRTDGIESLEVELPPALRFDDTPLRPDGGIVRVPALGLVARIGVRAPDRQRIVRAVGPLHPDHEIDVAVALPAARKLVVERPDGSPNGELLLLTDGRFGAEPRIVRLEQSVQTITGLPTTTFVSLYRDEHGQRFARVVEPDDTRLVLSPHPGASLTLHVEDNDGMRMHDARVFLFARRLPGVIGHEDTIPPIMRVPRRNGVIELLGLVAGEYEVRVVSPLDTPSRTLVELTPGKTTELGAVRLSPGYRLHGTVLDPSGKPAAGVLVTLAQLNAGPAETPRDVVTDSRGEFQFTGLADEVFVVEARRTTETRSELARDPRVVPGPEGIVLRLVDEDPTRRGK